MKLYYGLLILLIISPVMAFEVNNDANFRYIGIEETKILTNIISTNQTNESITFTPILDSDIATISLICNSTGGVNLNSPKTKLLSNEHCDLRAHPNEFGVWSGDLIVENDTDTSIINLHAIIVNSTFSSLFENITQQNITTTNDITIIPEGCELRNVDNQTLVDPDVTNITGYMLLCTFYDKQGNEFGFTRFYNDILNLEQNDITILDITSISTQGIEKLFEISEDKQYLFDTALSALTEGKNVTLANQQYQVAVQIIERIDNQYTPKSSLYDIADSSTINIILTNLEDNNIVKTNILGEYILVAREDQQNASLWGLIFIAGWIISMVLGFVYIEFFMS